MFRNILEKIRRDRRPHDPSNFTVPGNFEIEKLPGISVDSELLAAAGNLSSSSMEDGWNVSIAPTPEQVRDYRRKLIGFAAVLATSMKRGLGFTDEATAIATDWMLTRYIDRVDLNRRSYLDARFTSVDHVKSIEDKCILGLATPAERLLVGYSLQMPNTELGRIAAPSFRPVLVAEMEDAIDETIILLRGRKLDLPDKYVVDEEERLSDGTTISRIHRKIYVAEIKDGTIISRRLAFVVRTQGALALENMTVKDITEIPSVVQSDVVYGYNKDRHVTEVYASALGTQT